MIDIQHSNERNFCGAITPKEKDKIMKAILDMAAHERINILALGIPTIIEG